VGKREDRGLVISVRVETRSSCPGVAGRYGDGLRVRLKSPPVEGRANRELVEVLSHEFNIPKGNIEIISGKRSKNKLVRLRGITMEGIKGFHV
jgi:hypothetical protein